MEEAMPEWVAGCTGQALAWREEPFETAGDDAETLREAVLRLYGVKMREAILEGVPSYETREGSYYRLGERLVAFSSQPGNSAVFEVRDNDNRNHPPPNNPTIPIQDMLAALERTVARQAELERLLSPHLCERGNAEDLLQCLERVIRERDQAMGAANIVPRVPPSDTRLWNFIMDVFDGHLSTPVRADVPDHNPFDLRVTVGQLRQARRLLRDLPEPGVQR